MQVIDKDEIPHDLFHEAEKFSIFREDVKKYLKNNGKDFDKFSITKHDSYLGYFTEHVLKEHILTNLNFKNCEIETWEEQFDLHKIKDIIYNNKNDVDNLKYVQSYFYDKYDFKIMNERQEIKIDVKTAETKLTPNEHWNFLYPVIQAKKEGKDLIILCYYIKNSSDLKDLKNITIVGYMSEIDILNCDIIFANQYTNHHTKSQIDNYNTQLINYKNIKNIENLL